LKRHITYCKANHCTWAAEPGRLMCQHHWRLLPGALQSAVIETFKANPGAARQLSSETYLEAAAAAVEYIAAKEGRPTRNVFCELAKRVKNQEIKTCL
jgi:hypothetical protein